MKSIPQDKNGSVLSISGLKPSFRLLYSYGNFYRMSGIPVVSEQVALRVLDHLEVYLWNVGSDYASRAPVYDGVVAFAFILVMREP